MKNSCVDGCQHGGSYILNDKSQMLVMISRATDEMIRLVAMYPDVWFIDTTAGMYDAILCSALVFSHGTK